MIHVVTLTLLLLSSIISPTVASFDEGNGNGDGNGGGCVDGCGNGDGGSVPSIPIIPFKKQAANIVNIKEFNIKVDSIKVDVDNSKQCQNKGTQLGDPVQQCILQCVLAGGSPLVCAAVCTQQGTTTTTVIPPLDSTTPIFPDQQVPTKPDTTEKVLGEVDTQNVNVTTEGLPGIPIVSGPIITSFTFRIDHDSTGHIPVVTFIIRGKGFDISSLIDQKLVKQLGSLIIPRIYLGNICLTICKFTDTYIEARFEDIDDQKNFKPGTYLLLVKVLHIEKLKVPIIGITNDNTPTVSTLGGLTLPEVSIIGPKFPVLPLPIVSNPLISLFNGLKFDIATLSVTFATNDCDKIKAACKVV